jgi:hypothetical protein
MPLVPLEPLPTYAHPSWLPTGEAMAEEFAIRYHDRLRYVPELKSWIVKGDDGKWRVDRTNLALDLAGHMTRDISAGLVDPRLRMRLEATKTVTQVERRARSLRVMVGHIEDIDVDYSKDPVSLWLQDCCTVNSQTSTPLGKLYVSWAQWAVSHGVYRGTKVELSNELVRRKGITRRKSRMISVIRGLQVNQMDVEQAPIAPLPSHRGVRRAA